MTRTLSSLALLLAIALGIAPLQLPYRLAPTAEPDQPSAVGVVFSAHLSLPATPRARWALRLMNDSLHTNTCQAVTPCPTGSVGTALIAGYATFYEDPSQRIDHYAAAGPLLRDALGHWRGKVIRVTSGNRSTIVRLADFCACGERHGLPTLVDLSPAAFGDLAPLSAGIIRVEIELVALPATDSLPRNEADLRMMREVRGDELYREPVQ